MRLEQLFIVVNIEESYALDVSLRRGRRATSKPHSRSVLSVCASEAARGRPLAPSRRPTASEQTRTPTTDQTHCDNQTLVLYAPRMVISFGVTYKIVYNA